MDCVASVILPLFNLLHFWICVKMTAACFRETLTETWFCSLQVWSAAAPTPAMRTWAVLPLWPSRLWIKAWSAKLSSQSPPARSRFVPPSKEMDMWVLVHKESGQLRLPHTDDWALLDVMQAEMCLCLPVVKDPWWCWRCGPSQRMWTLHRTVGQVGEAVASYSIAIVQFDFDVLHKLTYCVFLHSGVMWKRGRRTQSSLPSTETSLPEMMLTLRHTPSLPPPR